MYGYTAEEILGKSIALLTPQGSGEMDEILGQIRAGQPVDHYQTERLRKDGSAIPISLTVSPIYDQDGEIIGASSIARDITQLTRADALLREASEYARSLIEASLDPLVTISVEGKITDVNEATAKVTGIERERLIGTDFSDYFTEPETAREGYRRVFAEGSVTDYPLTIRHRDGGLTDVLYNASEYRDAAGNVLGVFAAARDVTAQRQAEAEIAAQRAKDLERLAELERFQWLTVGRELKMIELKKEIAELKKLLPPDGGGGGVTLGEDGSGLSAVETSGYARAVLNMLEDLSEERGRMGDGQRALVNILEDSYEERTRLQDTQAAVLNILEDLQGEQGIRRLNAQLEDRVREGTEDLLQRTAELNAANQELEAFAYSLAHDLRTPIRAISAFGAVLARNHGDQLGDQGRETLERIRRASARMGELIDAMLLLAQLTRRELSFTSVDLSAAAREVSEELRAVDPARRVEFVIEDGLETFGDQRLVRVLIRNLLGNAWKFTSPREHARIEVTRAGAGVFAVRDNGVGFNMDFAGLLFKPFARLHGEDEFPGIGVGLTTAERIVRRHGGAVWGEGRPGEGATFYFKLEPPTETGS